MADIESVYDLDLTKFLAKIDVIDSSFAKVDKWMEKYSGFDPFKDAGKGAANFEKDLSSDLKAMVRLEEYMKSFKEEMKRFGTEQAKITKGQQAFTDAAKYDQVSKDLEELRAKLVQVSKELEDMKTKGDNSTGMFGRMGKGLGMLQTAFKAFIALEAVQFIYNVGKSVFDTTSKFEKYEKVLQTAFGSQKQAGQAMEALKKIAAETAFGMDELTEGYVKMVNRGLRPSTAEIVKLTDLAASQGKSFDQLVEAVLDAQTGEFERLKEFGIKAKSTANGVSLAFKGQTVEVKKNEKAIYDAIVAMGAINGVAGQNAELMSTLSGKTSNLSDSVDNLAVKFGAVLKPAFDLILNSAIASLGAVNNLLTAFTGWIGITSKAESSLSALNEQQKKTADSEKFLKPLIARYEELKGKTNLNKLEQDELKKVIEQIQKIVPDAATAFDAYGRALDINSGKVRDYLKSQGTLTKEMKDLAKENIGDELNQIGKKQLAIQKELEDRRVKLFNNGISTEQKTIKLTNQQIVDRQIELSELRAQEIKLRRDLRNLDRPMGAVGELPTEGGSITPPATGPDEKTLKARKKALEDAEKDLQNELLKIQKQYGQDKVEAMRGDELKYIEGKRVLNQQMIDEEQKTLLKLKQLEAGAKKGMFDADNKPIADKKTQLSASEIAPLDFKRSLVDDQAELEKAKVITGNEKKITESLSNEYQLQLQAIEHKYEEIFKLSELDGKKRVKLEKKKEEEIAKAGLDADIKKIDKKSELEMSDAEINVIKAQISGRKDLELKARRDLLEIEKKYIIDKIELLEESTDPEAKARIAGLQKALAQIDLGINALDKEGKKVNPVEKLLSSLGFNDEALEAVDVAANSIRNSVSELYNTLNQLSQQRISRLDDEISKKQEQVDAEKELSEKGAANNLSLRQKELADLKSARERALKDQQRLQKQQLIADTVIQTSSLITAASKVMSGFSSIPIVGVGLGIAAVALMLGAFTAAKIKAFQLTKSQSADQYEFGGEVGGKRHKDGGTLIEAEKGEYVTNRKSTAKYYDLIEAINKDNEGAIMDYLLSDLLKGSGVGLSEAARDKTVEFIREHRKTVRESENDQIRELRELKKELIEIKNSASRIPKTQMFGTGDGRYVEKSETGVIVRTLPDYD